jgi:hypothetical protein
LLMDRDKMSNLWVDQKAKITSTTKHSLTSDPMGVWNNRVFFFRKLLKSVYKSFTSFGWGVSEEKIKMWKVNRRRTTDAKWWQKLTLPLARWAKNSSYMKANKSIIKLRCIS